VIDHASPVVGSSAAGSVGQAGVALERRRVELVAAPVAARLAFAFGDKAECRRSVSNTW